MPLPTEKVEIGQWLGLQAYGLEFDTDPHYLTDVQNCDFDDDGQIMKRRGTNRVNISLTGAINMIYDFQSQQGFSTASDRLRVLIVAGSTLHVVKNFHQGGMTVEATFGTVGYFHYATSANNGACYISNEGGGAIKVLTYYGAAWRFENAAITAPASGPNVSTTTGASLSGAYSACFAYQDCFGNETDPSPQSASVTLSANALAVGVVASADPTIAQINLYVLRPDASEFKFSRSASNATATISHTVSDDTLDAAADVPVGIDPCPNGKYVQIFNSMLLVAGDTTLPDLVYPSNYQFHRQFGLDSDFARVTSGDGQPIRGFGRQFSQVIVAKADSLHLADGSDNTTFRTSPHNQEYGVLGQPSMTTFNQMLSFFSDDGIYIDDSLKPTEISQRIRRSMRQLNPANLATDPPKQVAATYKYYKQIFWSVREATGAGENDAILIWNYERDTWTKYKGISARCLGVVQNQDDYEFLFGGDSLGNVYRFSPPNGNSPNSDNHTGSTASISAYVVTPWMNLPKLAGHGDWERERTVPRYIKVYCGGEPATGNSTITLTTNYYVDFSDTIRATFSTTHAAVAWPNRKIDPKTIYYGGGVGTFNWIRFKFSNAVLDEHFYIQKIVLGFKAKPAVD